MSTAYRFYLLRRASISPPSGSANAPPTPMLSWKRTRCCKPQSILLWKSGTGRAASACSAGRHSSEEDCRASEVPTTWSGGTPSILEAGEEIDEGENE
jgi:hypothetical protein